MNLWAEDSETNPWQGTQVHSDLSIHLFQKYPIPLWECIGVQAFYIAEAGKHYATRHCYPTHFIPNTSMHSRAETTPTCCLC